MRRILVALAGAFAAAGAGGCGGAKFVRMQGDEGVVAIPQNDDAWPTHNRTKAMELIRGHVGPDFEIVKEEEVVTGQVHTDNAQVEKVPVPHPTIPFLATQETIVTHSTQTHDVKEWYIYYRKRPPAAK